MKIYVIIIVAIIISGYGIFLFENRNQEFVNSTLTISESCLKNEFYVINNLCDKTCHVNIECFGNVEHILVLGNVFACDGSIDLVFSNATKIHVGNNHISHSIQFLEIDEFVFEDTPTMDAITIRGN